MKPKLSILPITLISVLLIGLSLSVSSALAQSQTLKLNWVHAFGGTEINSSYDDGGRDVAVDNQGNTYVVGRFRGEVDLDPTSGVDIHNALDLSAFITKFNADGSYAWSRSFTEQVGGESEAVAIALDPYGWPVFVGRCKGTVDLDAGTGSHIVMPGYSNFGFLVRYQSDGTFNLARTWDLNGNWIYDVATAESGDMYVTGDFQGTTDFDLSGSNDYHVSWGSTDGFITKLYYDGDYAWTRSIRNSGDLYGNHLAVRSGNVILTGAFEGSVDFNPGAGEDIHTAITRYSPFITKFDTEGNYHWTKTILPSEGVTAMVGDVALDSQYNVLITGYFDGSVDFDGSGLSNVITAQGFADTFISKYNSSGGYAWTIRYGNDDQMTGERGQAIAIDSQDNIFIAGLEDNGSFGYSPFVAKYSSDTSLLFRTYLDVGSTSMSYGEAKGIALGESGSIYLVGNFDGTFLFDPSTNSAARSSVGGRDVFFAKYELTENSPTPTPTFTATATSIPSTPTPSNPTATPTPTPTHQPGNQGEIVTISGNVVNQAGAGVAGVMVYAEVAGENYAVTRTDSSGKYTLKVPAGKLLNITFQQGVAEFSPSQVQVTTTASTLLEKVTQVSGPDVAECKEQDISKKLASIAQQVANMRTYGLQAIALLATVPAKLTQANQLETSLLAAVNNALEKGSALPELLYQCNSSNTCQKVSLKSKAAAYQRSVTALYRAALKGCKAAKSVSKRAAKSALSLENKSWRSLAKATETIQGLPANTFYCSEE